MSRDQQASGRTPLPIADPAARRASRLRFAGLVVLCVLILGALGTILLVRVAGLATRSTAVHLRPVTVVLALRQPACRAMSPAQWSLALTIMERRASVFSAAYNTEPGRVAHSGPCAITVVATGIPNPAMYAATLSGRGHLVLYGMGDLPQLDRGTPFTHPTTARCDAPTAPVPCLVIDDNDLDRSQIRAGHNQYGSPWLRIVTKGAGTRRLATYTSAHINGGIAVVLDGMVLGDPTIQGAILDGMVQIPLFSSEDDARGTAIELSSGELPVAFMVRSIRQ